MEKKIIALHVIADHDFVHHTLSIECSCKPEEISKNVWKHQPHIKYRTYKLFNDGSFDMMIQDEIDERVKNIPI